MVNHLATSDDDIKRRVSVSWIKLKDDSGILCDKKHVKDPIVDKFHQNRVSWYCHVLRRPPKSPVQKSIQFYIPTQVRMDETNATNSTHA